MLLMKSSRERDATASKGHFKAQKYTSPSLSFICLSSRLAPTAVFFLTLRLNGCVCERERARGNKQNLVLHRKREKFFLTFHGNRSTRFCEREIGKETKAEREEIFRGRFRGRSSCRVLGIRIIPKMARLNYGRGTRALWFLLSQFWEPLSCVYTNDVVVAAHVAASRRRSCIAAHL